MQIPRQILIDFDLWELEDFSGPRREKKRKRVGNSSWKPITHVGIWSHINIAVISIIYCVYNNRRESESLEEEWKEKKSYLCFL